MNIEKIIELNNRLNKCIDIDDIIINRNIINIYFKEYCIYKYDENEIVDKFINYINYYDELINDEFEYELIIDDDDNYIIELYLKDYI